MAASPVRRAPYKDTLQPALHRRFSSTATLLLAVSYLEAVLLANWTSYFWSWFPIGPAGFRTALIFACGLSILVLRIAHYHVGLRTTESGLQSLTGALVNLQTYETGFWYGVSSSLFCPVFLWSMSENANLQWITYFGVGRARLNERPLFLACYLATCALWQTVSHYRKDLDRLDLSLPKPQSKDEQNTNASSSFRAITAYLPTVFMGCVQHAVTTVPIALVLYYLFMRSFAWSWALMVLRPFYNLPKTNIVPPLWPTDVFLLLRCIYAGTLLSFVWSAGNTAFAVFMVKEPLKNGKPLTSESKDPNGSLLNGLKNKKLSIKAFAMWELAIIAQNDETRRKAIFADIDRKDGPMWSQVYAICMEAIKSIEERVDTYGKPPAPAAPAPVAEPKQRVSAPLRDDPIYTKNPSASPIRGGAWDQIARAPGSSPVSELSPLAKKTWKNAKDKILSKEQQESVSAEHLKGQFGQLTAGLAKVDWIGALFRQDFHTEVARTVLGAPYGEPTLYINAASALSQLAAHSLTEDQFGNVHRDVPSIIRSLTAAIRKVEGLKTQISGQHTDEHEKRDCPEVDGVLDAMRSSLDRVVTVFEPYSTDLRLTLADVRLAKEAAEKPQPKPVEQKVVEEAPRPKTARPVVEDKAGSRREARRVNQRRPEMEQVR